MGALAPVRYYNSNYTLMRGGSLRMGAPRMRVLLFAGKVSYVVLFLWRFSVIVNDDMVQVTRKDQKEANENIIRRFNRRVLQSGVLANAKSTMRFEKPISKSERRKKAIIRRERRADKTAKMRLGVR